jgi:hypothetical protein
VAVLLDMDSLLRSPQHKASATTGIGLKKLTDIGLGFHPDMDFKKLTGRFSGHWWIDCYQSTSDTKLSIEVSHNKSSFDRFEGYGFY